VTDPLRQGLVRTQTTHVGCIRVKSISEDVEDAEGPGHAQDVLQGRPVLVPDVLDGVGAIVAPGTDLAAHEKLDAPPALLDPSQRRP